MIRTNTSHILIPSIPIYSSLLFFLCKTTGISLYVYVNLYTNENIHCIVSVSFTPTYKSTERDTNAPSIDQGNRNFNATITLRIPHQPIWITPSISEVLKDAWIQYVSFFIVNAFLLYRISSFVFRYKLLDTYNSADVVAEKMD